MSYKDLAKSAVRSSGLVTRDGSDAITVAPSDDALTTDLSNALKGGDVQQWNKAVTAWKAAHNNEDNHFPVLKDVVVEGKTLSGFKFEQVVLDNCVFHNCTLNDNTFTHSKLQNDTQFIDCNLNNTTFSKCVLDGACNQSEKPGVAPGNDGETYKTTIINGGQMTGTRIQESVLSNVKIDTNFNEKNGGNLISYNADMFCTEITNRAMAGDKATHDLAKGGLQVNNNLNVYNTHASVKEDGKVARLDMGAPALSNRMMGDDCPGLTPDLNQIMNYTVTTDKQYHAEEHHDKVVARAYKSYENLQKIDILMFGGGTGLTAKQNLPFHFRDNGASFSAFQTGLHLDTYAGDANTSVFGPQLGYTSTLGTDVNGNPSMRYSANANINTIGVASDVKQRDMIAPGANVAATFYRGNLGATLGVDAYYLNATHKNDASHLTYNAKPMVIPSLMMEYNISGADKGFGYVHVFTQVSKLLSKSALVDDNSNVVSSPGHGAPRVVVGIKAGLNAR